MPRRFTQQPDHTLQRAARLELARCHRQPEAHELDELDGLFDTEFELLTSFSELADVN